MIDLPSDIGAKERGSFRSVFGPVCGYLTSHILMAPFLAVNGLLRAKRRGYRKLMWQRLFQAEAIPSKGDLLIIAGGLGEVRVAIRLKELLDRERQAKCSILVQSDETLPLATDPIPVFAAPFNNPISAWLCVRRWKPAAVWIIEFWDNHHMKIGTARRGIPTITINATMSELGITQNTAKPKTLWRFKLIGLYAAQEQIHVERMMQLGVDSDRLAVTGRIGSWLPDRSAEKPEANRAWRERLGIPLGSGPLIVAACTYQEDEPMVLEAFGRLKEKQPEAVLLLAPRRLKRLSEVQEWLSSQGVVFRLRSQPEGAGDVILLDGYGELSELYAIADFAYVGGGFSPGVGGHTPAEAASWNVQATIGPSCYNHLPLIEQLQAEGRIAIIQNAEELLASWLAAPCSSESFDLTAPRAQAIALELYDYTMKEANRGKV